MYNKIVNPLTNRKVNITSKIGRKVLKNYLNQLGGALNSSTCGTPSVQPNIGEVALYRDGNNPKICRNAFGQNADELDSIDRRNIIVVKKGQNVYCDTYDTILTEWNIKGNLCSWRPCTYKTEFTEGCGNVAAGCNVRINYRDYPVVINQLETIAALPDEEWSSDAENGIYYGFIGDNSVTLAETKVEIARVVAKMRSCAILPSPAEIQAPGPGFTKAIFAIFALFNINQPHMDAAISVAEESTLKQDGNIVTAEEAYRWKCCMVIINSIINYLDGLSHTDKLYMWNKPLLDTAGGKIRHSSSTFGDFLIQVQKGQVMACVKTWTGIFRDFYAGLITELPEELRTNLPPITGLVESEDCLTHLLESGIGNDILKGIIVPSVHDILTREELTELRIESKKEAADGGSRIEEFNDNINSFVNNFVGDDIKIIQMISPPDPSGRCNCK